MALDAFFPTVVIGGGVAGFRAALEAARSGRVLIVTKDSIRESNTAYAQGGVAAALGRDDSADFHRDDTLATGVGLCDPAAVEAVVREAPARIAEMLEWGGRFDRDGEDLHLGREGGHSRRRILHAHGDATGREFVRALLGAVRSEPAITLWEHGFAVDLLLEEGRCAGVLVLRDGRSVAVGAGSTILCTGGAGQIYRETTNPPIATGDGIAMAYRAGAEIADMEFVQFHPTTLYVAGSGRHLITEAVRGEGAHLVDERGERYLFQYHPDGELAPRDIVSRATVQHLASTDSACVFLDLRHMDRVAERFPGLGQTCALYNLDIRRDLVPVHPSAHYMVGGVAADLDGRTSIEGLYAAGEVAASGLHGANRLASNSLIEGLVFGRRAGLHAAGSSRPVPKRAASPKRPRSLPSTVINVEDMRNSIQALMWRWVGIARHGSDLARAGGRLSTWMSYVEQVDFQQPGGLAMENSLTVAWLVARAAEWRRESRGTHFRADFPEQDDVRFRVHSCLFAGGEVFAKPLVGTGVRSQQTSQEG